MKWEDVRKNYPNQWVKINIIKRHTQDGKEYIDEMDVICPIISDLEAGRELVKSKENEVVYHTSHEEIYLEIRNVFGFRMVK